MAISALMNVLNSMPNSQALSARCCSAQRPVSGNIKAAHAFMFQARLVIAMYAQLLTNVSTGACNAWTPA